MRKEIERAIYLQRDVTEKERHGETNEDLLKEAREIFTRQDIVMRKLAAEQAEKKQISEKTELKIKTKAEKDFENSLELQIKKQELIEGLRKSLNGLKTNPDFTMEAPESARRVFADSDGKLWTENNGEKKQISFGDVIADAEWGINYHLDKSIPLALRKRHLLERTKSNLRDLFNLQLALLDPGASGAYVKSNEKTMELVLETGEAGRESYGLLAERMAYSFFLRKSYDGGNIFRAMPGDFYADSHEKIDFALQRKNPFYNRGVKTAPNESIRSVGVQFTIRKKSGGKRKQIEAAKVAEEIIFDDVVIIKLPGNWPEETFHKWFSAGKPSGGPERFLDEARQKQLYFGTLKKMFTQEEIEEQWSRVVASQKPTRQPQNENEILNQAA